LLFSFDLLLHYLQDVLEVEEYLWRYIEQYHSEQLQSVCGPVVTYVYSNDSFQHTLEVVGGTVESVHAAAEHIAALYQRVADRVTEETFPLPQDTHEEMLQGVVKDLAENEKLICCVTADRICHIVGAREMVPGALKRVLDVSSASVNGTDGSDASVACEPSTVSAISQSTSNRYSMLTPGGMRVEVYQGDLVAETVDAIVNPANSRLRHGGGAARAIADAAGWLLEDECRDFIRQHQQLNVTEVMHTSAGNLKPKITFVIHAVGPRVTDYPDTAKLFDALKATFINCLYYADIELHVSSVSIPAISSGTIYCFSHLILAGYFVLSSHFLLVLSGKINDTTSVFIFQT